MIRDWRISFAYRLFRRGAGYRSMSFVGILAVSGLALAVAVLITVLSVVNGFDRELRERVLGVLPQGRLYARSGDIDWERLRMEALSHPAIIGAAPSVEGVGLVIHAGNLQGIQYRGISTELESSVSNILDYVTDGGLEALDKGKFGVILGAELASALNAQLDDEITLVLPDIIYTLAGASMTTRQLKIVGLFKVGADIDKNLVLLRLKDAMKLKRQADVDSLTLRFSDLFQASVVLHEFSLTSSQDVFGVSWIRQNGNLYDAIQTQKATMFLLLMVLVAVAAFNLVSNQVMTVADSRSEIAVLKTMGVHANDLLGIYVAHGLMVCVVGLFFGLLMGVVLTIYLSSFYNFFSEILSLNLMSEYFIRHLPTDIRLSDIGLIVFSTLVVCFVATVFPALKAAKTNPVEILVNEH